MAAASILLATGLTGCSLAGAQQSQGTTSVSPGTTGSPVTSTTQVPRASASPGADESRSTTTVSPGPTASADLTTPTASPSARWPEGHTITVLGLGDSVMSAPGCDCSGPVAQYGALLQADARMPVTATNQGENGMTAAGLSARIDGSPELQATLGRADLVMLTVGANDVAPLSLRWESCAASCWNPVVARMGVDLGAILDDVARLRAGHPTQVLVSNYWNVLQDGATAEAAVGTDEVSWNRDLTSATNAEIAAVVEAHGAHLVDLVKPFLGPGGDGDPTSKLLSDGDHPNASGVAAMAQAFLAATS